MHERIGVDNDEQDRREEEEGEQRQVDLEERQFDRLFEKQSSCVTAPAATAR